MVYVFFCQANAQALDGEHHTPRHTSGAGKTMRFCRRSSFLQSRPQADDGPALCRPGASSGSSSAILSQPRGCAKGDDGENKPSIDHASEQWHSPIYQILHTTTLSVSLLPDLSHGGAREIDDLARRKRSSCEISQETVRV